MAREAIKIGFEKAGSGIRYRKMHKGHTFTSPVYPQDSRRNKSEAWGLFLEFRDAIDTQMKQAEHVQLANDPLREDTVSKIQTLKAVAEMSGDEAGERWASKVLKILRKTDALGVEQIREELELDDDLPDPLLSVGKVIADARQAKGASDDLSCLAQADAFRAFHLDRARTNQISYGRYGKIDHSLAAFCEWYGEGRSLRHLTEATISGYYKHLLGRIADGDNANTMRDHLAVAKQFLNEIADDNPDIPRPSNLNSKKYVIQRVAREPDPFSKEEIKLLLENATEKTRLYLLLMLNMGAYQSDIGGLTPSEVRWKEGRVIRPRSKKEKAKKHTGGKVIKINWLLWNTTADLLRQHGLQTGDFALLNEEGQPLWQEGVNPKTRKTWRKDNIKSAYARLITKLKNRKKLPKKWNKTLKQFRKTGANLLEKSKDHAQFYEMYLDHSSVAKQFYLSSGEPVPQFDAAIQWLGSELGMA